MEKSKPNAIVNKKIFKTYQNEDDLVVETAGKPILIIISVIYLKSCMI